MDAKSLFWGALAGATAALGIWLIADRYLKQQLQTGAQRLQAELSAGSGTLERRLAAGRAEMTALVEQKVNTLLPPVVQNAVQQKFNSIGLTAARAVYLRQALDYAERAGVL